MGNKIGILTYHDAFNYGAVLQNYALENVLRKLHPDKEVETIDYKCEAVITKSHFSDMAKSKGVVSAVLHYPGRKRIAATYSVFRDKYLNLSKTFKTHKELSEVVDDYAAIVSGSDQVWNTRFNGNDSVYVQDFHEQNEKKYSYAVSLGEEHFRESEVSFYQKVLGKFRVISMREANGKVAVEEQFGFKAYQHIDPVFLLTRDEWNGIAKSPVTKKYILVYMVPYQKDVIDYARKCGKKMNLPVVVITKSLKPYFMKHRDSSTPSEFIGMIRDAELVITNSFHGTAFSIIYHKKFALELNNIRGFNYRSANLLDIFEMHYEKEKSGLQRVHNVDWNQVEEKIKSQRKNSIEYLKSIGE